MRKFGGYNRSVDFLEMIKNTSAADSQNRIKNNTKPVNSIKSEPSTKPVNSIKSEPSIKLVNGIKPESTIKPESGIKTEKSFKTKNIFKTESSIETENNIQSVKASSQTSSKRRIVVIDTETNWNDEVMSIGLAVADADTFKCTDLRYYIIEPESLIGGMFSGVMHESGDIREIVSSRREAISDIKNYLKGQGIDSIFAYNARFDKGHLPELGGFEWFDIMRIAAYKQYNFGIPENAECCKTGRLKRGYGVEDILRMIGDDCRYQEVHNAVRDAEDELMIMELLKHPLEIYDCARI